MWLGARKIRGIRKDRFKTLGIKKGRRKQVSKDVIIPRKQEKKVNLFVRVEQFTPTEKLEKAGNILYEILGNAVSINSSFQRDLDFHIFYGAESEADKIMVSFASQFGASSNIYLFEKREG